MFFWGDISGYSIGIGDGIDRPRPRYGGKFEEETISDLPKKVRGKLLIVEKCIYLSKFNCLCFFEEISVDVV